MNEKYTFFIIYNDMLNKYYKEDKLNIYFEAYVPLWCDLMKEAFLFDTRKEANEERKYMLYKYKERLKVKK
ncbi:MAG: hypothetical protein LIR50_05325 [Bacillota bacterium]|nr:hypothetical protein [Bacillota bacterium]